MAREEARAAGLDAFARAGIAAPVVGVSPGAAYGDAKRWLPERFAETAARVARRMPLRWLCSARRRNVELCESLAGTIARRANRGAQLRR